MKKILSLLLVVAMLLTCMVACGKTEEPAAPAAEAEAEAAAMPGEISPSMALAWRMPATPMITSAVLHW